MPLDLFAAAPPEVLTAAARRLIEDLEANRFIFGQVLPTVTIPDIDYRFSKGDGALVEAAEFRNYDAETPIGKRRSVIQKTGELPPIGLKIPMGEYQRLRLRKASEDEYVNAVLDDVHTTTTAVAARLELARSEALYAGQVVLSENGVSATISYGRTGSHTQSAAVVWSSPSTAVPITDLKSGASKIRAAGGVISSGAGAIVMNSQTYGEMIETDQVKNLATVSGTTPSLVSDTVVSAILTNHGLPSITIYDAVVDVGGSTTKVLADGKVIMYGAGSIGSTLSGITAEQMEYAADTTVTEPGIVALAWTHPDPVRIWTKSTAIAAPIVPNTDFTVGIAV